MLDFRKSSLIGALRKVLKRVHYPLEGFCRIDGQIACSFKLSCFSRRV